MKRLVQLCSALAISLSGAAQLDHKSLGTGFSTGERHFSPSQQQQGATVNIGDTLHYFFNKHYYENTTLSNANTQFYTIKSPYQVSSLNLTHAGAIFLNPSTVTVHGLEGLVMRNPNSTNSAVGVKLFLYNVNASNIPVLPAVDSVMTTVSNSTAGVWVGGNFSSPVTMTANFAVGFRVGSTVSGDTIRLFLNNANAPTSTVTGVPKYGEGLGLIRYGSTGPTWQKTTGTFGAGTDHEFVVAPRVSFSYQAGISVVSPTVCNNSMGSFSNTSSPDALIEHRQYNFNKFAAYWAPTNSLMPTTDSIYTWNFTGSSPPSTFAKNPSVLFNTAGTQNASLTVRYWYSASAGFAALPTLDGTSTTIFVDATSSPSIAVSGATNICSGQSTTLTASSTGSITWLNPSTSGNSVVVSPTSLSIYTVQSSNTGCTALKIITVQVSPAPTVQVNGPSSVCSGQSFTLAASGAQNYLWSNTLTQPVITQVITNAGVTQYTVTGSSGACPTSSAVISVSVHALPAVSVSVPAGTVCTKATGGTSLSISGIPSGGTFSGINVIGSSFTPQNNTGVFAIQYSYTDPGTNCSANAVTSVTVVTCTTGTVGVDEHQGGLVTVYPNPATGGVAFLNNLSDATSLSVFNILGEKVRSESVNGSQHKLDLSSLPQGQYFVRVTGAKGVIATVKIINQQ